MINQDHAPDCSTREDYAPSPLSLESYAGVCESGALYSSGWVKLHRRLLDHPKINDSEYMWLWVYLLLKANYTDGKFSPTKYQTVTVKRGQLITSRDSLSKATGINESTVGRMLKHLESEQQIEQQTFSKYRLITIVNYERYQQSEQQNEQQVNSKRTASEHNIRSKEVKKDKNTYKNTSNIPEILCGVGCSPNENPSPNEKIKDPKINIDGTDFVKMTQKQIDNLKENLGKERAIEMIIRLDGYIGQIGEKKASKLYNSHYHTILNWHRKDISEGKYPK